MFWWFGRKARPQDPPPAQPVTGGPQDRPYESAEAREKVYRRFFGEPAGIYRGAVPLSPGIEVRTYGYGPGNRDFWTLVTSGMSDVAMNVPPGAGAPTRVELIFYCSEPRHEYLETLLWLARYPQDHKTWLAAGQTIPNGNPPKPFWGSAVLNRFLLKPTIMATPDGRLPEELRIAGDPVHFLWVVPATGAEIKLKKERRHHVFDAGRRP